MVFSWPCVGCKLISVFILPSNTIFRKIERERELSESEIKEEERGREHTPPTSQAPAREIAPRKRSNPERKAVRLRLRHSTSNRILRLRRSTSPFDFAVRRRLHTDRDRSRSTDSSSPIAIVAPQNRSSSSSFFSQFDRIMFFFFFLLGFICVSELRDEIIYLFGKWENVFSVWFWFLLLSENSIFNQTTKHQKIFSTTFSEMLPNT